MFHQPQHQADSLRAALGKIRPVGAHVISDQFETSREVSRIFFESMIESGYVGQFQFEDALQGVHIRATEHRRRNSPPLQGHGDWAWRNAVPSARLQQEPVPVRFVLRPPEPTLKCPDRRPPPSAIRSVSNTMSAADRESA